MRSRESESESLADPAIEAWPHLVLLSVTQTTTLPSCWREQSALQAGHTALRAQWVSDQLSFPSRVLRQNYPYSYTEGLQWAKKKALLNSLTYLSRLLNKSAILADRWLGVKWVYSIQGEGQREGIFTFSTLDSHFNMVCLMNRLTLWSALLHNAYHAHIYCGPALFLLSVVPPDAVISALSCKSNNPGLLVFWISVSAHALAWPQARKDKTVLAFLHSLMKCLNKSRKVLKKSDLFVNDSDSHGNCPFSSASTFLFKPSTKPFLRNLFNGDLESRQKLTNFWLVILNWQPGWQTSELSASMCLFVEW